MRQWDLETEEVELGDSETRRLGKQKAGKTRQGDIETEEVDLRWKEEGRVTGKLEGRVSETWESEEVELEDWEISILGKQKSGKLRQGYFDTKRKRMKERGREREGEREREREREKV